MLHLNWSCQRASEQETWYSCRYLGLWCVKTVSGSFVYYFLKYIKLYEPGYGHFVYEIRGYSHLKQTASIIMTPQF